MTDSAAACPTWCTGHDHTTGEQHYAEIARVSLVDLAEQLGVRNNCARPVRVSLSSWADDPDSPVLVELEVPGGTAGFVRCCEWLTPDEARSVAHALLTAADLAEHPEAEPLADPQTSVRANKPAAVTPR